MCGKEPKGFVPLPRPRWGPGVSEGHTLDPDNNPTREDVQVSLSLLQMEMWGAGPRPSRLPVQGSCPGTPGSFTSPLFSCPQNPVFPTSWVPRDSTHPPLCCTGIELVRTWWGWGGTKGNGPGSRDLRSEREALCAQGQWETGQELGGVPGAQRGVTGRRGRTGSGSQPLSDQDFRPGF